MGEPTNLADELLPCPCCSGDPLLVPHMASNTLLYFIICETCGLQTPKCSKPDDVADIWNTRATEPAHVADDDREAAEVFWDRSHAEIAGQAADASWMAQQVHIKNIAQLIATTRAQGRAEAQAEIVALREAWCDVVAERQRQIEQEGWTPEHDDEHVDTQLAGAAACYALATVAHWAAGPAIQQFWPWDHSWWKPSDDPRRNLVKSGALILAEIERLDRAIERGDHRKEGA